MIYTKKMMERECERRLYQQYQDERIEMMDLRLSALKEKVCRLEKQLDRLEKGIPKEV